VRGRPRQRGRATHSLNLVDGIAIGDVVLLTLDERRRTRVDGLGVRTGSPIERHLGDVGEAANEAWPRVDRPWAREDFTPPPAAVGALLREHGQDPPASRTEMIMDLVLRLERPEDVPRELREVFTVLRTCAQ
jgi:hypothetical protein